jgi:hypothetical protein
LSVRKAPLAQSKYHQDPPVLDSDALMPVAPVMLPATLAVTSNVSPPKFLPATLALMLQLAALLCVLAITWLMQWIAAVYFSLVLSLPVFVYVLLQAILAACFSMWMGMASWWRWIHAGFPLAIWLMALLQLPSEWYLFGFVISLALFWTTFRSQVPFFPSRPDVWKKVAQLLPASSLRIVDIGSGLGDLSMHLSAHRADCCIEGIEIAPLPWMLSSLRARLRRSTATFTLGDYHALDFADYDVVFAYLSPAAMSELWQKVQREMRPGTMLISFEFVIPGVVPTKVESMGANRPSLYLWTMPE